MLAASHRPSYLSRKVSGGLVLAGGLAVEDKGLALDFREHALSAIR
jgi:hypothetical protein